MSTNEIIQKVEVSGHEFVNIELSVNEIYLKQIQFSTDAGICKVEGDPRGLYFNVKNLEF